MNWSMVKKDLIRNKGINVTLLLFIMFSASLAVLSILMAAHTFTSISDLYQTAQPPHFVQMHKGELQPEQVDRFLSKNPKVVYSQIDTMIDVYGDNLTVVGKERTFRLSDCRLDIGLVKQNQVRDLLLDSEHNKVTLKSGEIGVPVLLKSMYGMEIGDHLILTEQDVRKEYVIKEFILDSMMNSSMAASTRILLADQDYEAISGVVGEKEYLIEAYFNLPKEANSFKTVYQDAGLPQNGQVVTYSIIFIMSAITDIVIVFVMLLVSGLLLLVSFLCLKYTIMAALEEEINEIGTMKAIGLAFTDIRNLYLYKYRILALIGSIAGFFVAMLVSGIFTQHINTMFGNGTLSFFTVLLSAGVCCLIFLFIHSYCMRILKQIKNLTVVDALVSGNGFSKRVGKVHNGLHRSMRVPINGLIGFREVFYQFRHWNVVFGVVVISVLIIMVPFNLLNTFEAPQFITYMGSNLEDILIEVENGENLEIGHEKVEEVLNQDTSIQNYSEYRTVRVKTLNSDKILMNLDIDCGEDAGEGLKYLSGSAPREQNEIAISYLNANEMKRQVGDKLPIWTDHTEQSFIITGIYQDVTSGGYTAKASNNFMELEAIKYSFSVNLIDNIDVNAKAQEWSKRIGNGVSVDPMEEFIHQTLGGVSAQLKKMVFVIILIGACLVMLITVLFLKLRLAKDMSDIAVLKAIGFTERDIRHQYMIKSGCVAVTGIVIGILLTEGLGDKIVELALSMAGIGIKQVQLIADPVMQYLLCPGLLLVIILLVTRKMTHQINKYNIISIIE